MNKVWITRTWPGAEATAELICAHGAVPVVAPLLTVIPATEAPSCPDQDSILVFTSKNGVLAFADLFDVRDYDVVTVGDGTAQLAEALGFARITSAGGTSDDVTHLIKKTFKPEHPVVHCAGKHVRGKIVEDLQLAGFVTRRDLYYLSDPVKSLPDIALQELTHILLYSPLAAQTLAQFSPDISHCHIVSISQATDAALGNISTRTRYVADAPNEEAMFTLLSV